MSHRDQEQASSFQPNLVSTHLLLLNVVVKPLYQIYDINFKEHSFSRLINPVQVIDPCLLR